MLVIRGMAKRRARAVTYSPIGDLVRFLVDMNLSPLWVDTLNSAGYESVHWSSIGPANAPDSMLMSFAREEGWIVFTHDLDFGALLAHSGAEGPSVVQLREQDVDPANLGPSVISGLSKCRESLEQGALVTMDLRRSKARVLPLRR
jgi:predicted nuclease of predicted toxin-antitoxin system